MWVYSEMDNIYNFPYDLKEKLSHIILSHHGRVEWGTAILPKTKEAEFFHMADHRSATIAKGY
jgi:3'-5' exoribonuclease